MQQYEILRDVITIVISAVSIFAALLSALIFFALRTALTKDITIEVKKYVDKECCRLRGQTDLQAGVTYWTQGMFDHAIEHTKRALKEAGDVLEEDKMVFACSNLGYYYAEKHKKEKNCWEFKEEAVNYSKLGFDKYSPTDNNFKKPDWIDNYVFVKAVFTKTNTERDDLLKLIDELKGRQDLRSIHPYLEESRGIAQSNMTE